MAHGRHIWWLVVSIFSLSYCHIDDHPLEAFARKHSLVGPCFAHLVSRFASQRKGASVLTLRLLSEQNPDFALRRVVEYMEGSWRTLVVINFGYCSAWPIRK